MLQQAKNSEEKAKKAMVDAARLADELRAEQDHSSSQEKAKRALETQVVELENRLAEANEMAVKGGRNPWLNLKEESVKWKWNWEEFKARHLKPTSPTKNLSVASRNWTSNAMKIRRIPTVSPNW